MKILGIDPGYARLGYAVLEKIGENYKIAKLSLAETSSSESKEKRILHIGETVSSVIKECKPDAVAVEKLFFAKNQKTALQVSEVKGVIAYLSAKNNIPCHEFTPLEVKMAICGYGKADKKQIQNMVKIILKTDDFLKQDDAVDAAAIALTYFLTKNTRIA